MWLAFWKALDRRMLAAGMPPLPSCLPDSVRDRAMAWLRELGQAEKVSDGAQVISELFSELSLEDVSGLFDALLPVFDVDTKMPPEEHRPIPETAPALPVGTIEPIELVNRIRTLFFMPPVILDARSADAFEKSHILQARSTPEVASEQSVLEALDKDLRDALRYGKEELVVLYGSSPDPSEWMQRLGRRLARDGHDVRFLTGGFDAFLEKRAYACTSLLPSESPTYFSGGESLPAEIIDGFLFLGDRVHGANAQMLRDLGITQGSTSLQRSSLPSSTGSSTRTCHSWTTQKRTSLDTSSR